MITIWRVSLATSNALTADRLRWLAADERDRARRFHAREHADAWRIARIALRDLLGRATGIAPGELRFATAPGGKPFLTHAGSPQFSLSHSGDIAVIAVGESAPIGVDVEVIKPVPEMAGVVEHHFAAEEQSALWAAPEPAQLDAFYRCWTRKEAYVKATGIGVGPALARFAVSLDRNDVRLLRADDDPSAPVSWTLLDLELGLPYIGALAVLGRDVEVEQRTWQPAG